MMPVGRGGGSGGGGECGRGCCDYFGINQTAIHRRWNILTSMQHHHGFSPLNCTPALIWARSTISCPTWWRTRLRRPTSCQSSSICCSSGTTITSGNLRLIILHAAAFIDFSLQHFFFFFLLGTSIKFSSLKRRGVLIVESHIQTFFWFNLACLLTVSPPVCIREKVNLLMGGKHQPNKILSFLNIHWGSAWHSDLSFILDRDTQPCFQFPQSIHLWHHKGMISTLVWVRVSSSNRSRGMTGSCDVSLMETSPWYLLRMEIRNNTGAKVAASARVVLSFCNLGETATSRHLKFPVCPNIHSM